MDTDAAFIASCGHTYGESAIPSAAGAPALCAVCARRIYFFVPADAELTLFDGAFVTQTRQSVGANVLRYNAAAPRPPLAERARHCVLWARLAPRWLLAFIAALLVVALLYSFEFNVLADALWDDALVDLTLVCAGALVAWAWLRSRGLFISSARPALV